MIGPMTRRGVLAGAGALALSACASTSQSGVLTGAYKVGEAYTLTLGSGWADISVLSNQTSAGVRLLTIDGPLLNRLYATQGLKEGQSIIRQTGAKRDNPLPGYRAGMTSRDLVEMITETVELLGYIDPEAMDQRPAKFGGADGVRFEIAARTAQGLAIAGTALVAEARGRAHVLLFLAPKEHYFVASLAEVESIFASATLQP